MGYVGGNLEILIMMYLCSEFHIMQIKKILLLSILATLGIVTITYMIYAQVWEQHVRCLNGTIERGIMMQMTIDQFDKSIGRYPTYSEFTNVYSYISSFQQGVTMTNQSYARI